MFILLIVLYAFSAYRWERKLPMSKSPLESTWLYHEIGRCYLELNKFSEAKNYGEQSDTAALEAEDQMWQLQASVLIAQAEGRGLPFLSFVKVVYERCWCVINLLFTQILLKIK